MGVPVSRCLRRNIQMFSQFPGLLKREREREKKELKTFPRVSRLYPPSRLWLNWWGHRVIILNRGSMFAFQWREFSSSSTTIANERYETLQFPGNSPSAPPPPPATIIIGSLANECAVSSDVTLWRCTFWSGKFASVSSYSIVNACSL